MTESIHFREQKVHINFRNGCAGYDISEKVWPPIVGLISDHQCSGLHHSTLQYRADLKQKVEKKKFQ